MSFKYINPGYANLFDGTTDVSITQSTDPAFSKTGVSMDIDAGYVYKKVNTNEMWVRFDLYCTGPTYSIDVIYFYDGNNYCCLDLHEIALDVYINNEKKEKNFFYLLQGTLRSFLVHIKSSSNDGIFEVYVDGKLRYDFYGNILNGEQIIQVRLQTTRSNKVYMSNVILSDEYIAPTETIMPLPVLTKETTMKDNGDGSYTADEVGQKIEQTIDTDLLLTQINKYSTITGISLIGNPAYYDGSSLAHIASTVDGKVKESIGISTNEIDGVISSYGCEEELSYLKGKKFGWQAKT